MRDQEKATIAALGIKSFIEQFGEVNENSTILLNILLEELYYASPIFIFSESEQEGDKIDLSDQIGSNESEIKDTQSE